MHYGGFKREKNQDQNAKFAPHKGKKVHILQGPMSSVGLFFN